MSGRLQVLKSDIQVELAAIERLFEALPSKEANLADARETIVTGYYLHNLYNAFESVFQLVADAFENHIPDTGRWHSLLLERMARDIEEMRPYLISEVALENLDELRRFRHLFRHLYRYDLKPEGVRQALQQAQQLKAVYRTDIDRFIHFLEQLAEVE